MPSCALVIWLGQVPACAGLADLRLRAGAAEIMDDTAGDPDRAVLVPAEFRLLWRAVQISGLP